MRLATHGFLMRILFIEDEPDLVEIVSEAFVERQIRVDTARDGREGLLKAQTVDYDAIVLDLMLPALDGQTLLCELRQTHATPVVVLTARDAADLKIRLLNAGADDYLTKPFVIDELIARIDAVVRRSTGHACPMIELEDDIYVDTQRRVVLRGGQPIELTPTEFLIFRLLASRRGQIVSRQMIYDRVYGDHESGASNTIDVYLSNLRRKIGRDLILTRRGEGYQLRA